MYLFASVASFILYSPAKFCSQNGCMCRNFSSKEWRNCSRRIVENQKFISIFKVELGSSVNPTVLPGKHLPTETATGKYDEKVDIFSLGLLLLKLCTNEDLDDRDLQLTPIPFRLPAHLKGSQIEDLISKMLVKVKRPSAMDIMKEEFVNYTSILCKYN